MNQIEINKIVRTDIGGEGLREGWEIVAYIYHSISHFQTKSIELFPSQMKELKEKINKLDI